MNLIQFDGQKTIRDFHLLPTMLYMEPSDILFITRFPNDARTASELGINTFLLIREDFHPEFKNLIKKAEEIKGNAKKDHSKPGDPKKGDRKASEARSLTDVHQYKSGLFSLTSKINQLSKLGGGPLSEDQKTKLMSMYDSFEDPSHLPHHDVAQTKENDEQKEVEKKGSETDIKPSPSAVSVSDLVNTKYILNLSDLQFK